MSGKLSRTQKWDRIQADLAAVQQKWDRIQADLAAVQQKWDQTQADLAAVQQKYDLVSTLLAAKSSENEAFEQFKKVFNEDFMAFANKESSLADEAAAVQRLQALEKRLEQIVASPHMFAKRSVAIGGGFSSGKSAFVNSFIAQPGIRLPVGIQPVTAIPSYVMASKDVSIKGYTRTGATVDIAQDLYEQLSHGAFSFNLKDLMPSIAVEVPLQAGFEHICLLDTPGYDPAGGQTSEDEATAAEFLKDQDALIWMVDVAKGTVEQEDLNFIEGLGLNGRPFYVVVNKADNRPPNELAGVLAEVKETLEDAELKPLGIGAYCSLRNERGREYPSEGLSLPDFFRCQNQPVENLEPELKAELESVFSMYEKAIDKDEQSAKLLTKKLNKLDLDLNEKVDEDVAEEFGKTIDKIKRDQNRDFAPIKQELARVKKAMFAAVEQVLRSLVDEESAAELSKIRRQQARPSERSQPTRPRQPVEEPARRRATGRAKDAKGRYALHEAAAHNNHEKASALLRGGADPNAKDKQGLTPLHHAAKQNARETVEVLLDARASRNPKDKQGLTPLHHAAKQGARETVEVLLDAGVSRNPKDKQGLTPLHHAAEQDAHKTVKVLLDRRRTSTAKVHSMDKEGRTPLHYAAAHDAHQAAKVLLTKGAAPNVKDKDGYTPLDYAAEQDAHQTVKVLLDAGAEHRDQAALEKQHRAQAALRRDQAALEKQRRAQAALAEERKRGKEVSLPGGVSMTFVWIEPGVFQMGSPASETSLYGDERPVHEVSISEGFWLGQYAVTQGQWESVLRDRPWSGKRYVVENSSHPAVYISWDAVQGFIAKLNALAGASLYRLPSEAEWEYACRAGTSTRWSFGDDERHLTDYAWYRDNAEYDARAVGLKRPNPWGLYDMHGNVREWVQDWYKHNYYNNQWC